MNSYYALPHPLELIGVDFKLSKVSIIKKPSRKRRFYQYPVVV